MPIVNIIKTNELKRSFRVDSIIDRHELDPRSADVHLDANIPIEQKAWKIGLIVGSSGSGKSTIAREMFGQDYVCKYNYGDSAIIDEMPKDCSIDQISKTFNSVGFGTIWHWIKPYSVLSYGEQMRVDIAQAILSERSLVVFDEFTSVIDRSIAKVASAAISKAIRKSPKQFVAVTCHRDVTEWLEPDWIYDTDEKRFFFALENIKDQKCVLKFDQYLSDAGNVLSSFTI